MAAKSPIQFDPQRRATESNLKGQITELGRHLAAEERRLGTRTRARKEIDRKRFALAVEAIACNLLVTAMVAPDARLAIQRSNGAMWGRGRYHSPVYGQHFRDAADLMQRLGLLHVLSTGYRFTAKDSRQTTIRAADPLSDHLPLGATDLTMFTREADLEPIVLRSEKDQANDASSSLEYKDSARTLRMRREIRAINRWLADAPISVVGSDGCHVVLDQEGQPIEPYRRTLRRIFNNGTWQQGGRLYDGFWMNMERRERFRTIRIQEEEIANVDYQSLFPRMAYVRAQAEQPTDDIYDIHGDVTHRDGWKVLTNALLFANRRIQRWPRRAREQLPTGIKLFDAVNAIKQRHAPIASLFEKGLGFQLMRLESDLLILVVTALFKQGIAALPLHDSVLVARSQAEAAKCVMEEAFKLYTGSGCAFVKIDFGPN